MALPRVHIYAVCWNERRILPYFLRHYEAFAERIVVYDDGSNDGSIEILKANSRVEVRKLPGSRISPEEDRRNVKSHAWKECRGLTDWVIACDTDEFLHHSRLPEFLTDCQARGITMPIPTGYQFFAEWFPTTTGQIYDELRFGFPDREYDKPLLFDPNAIEDLGYDAGCHRTQPSGRIVIERSPQLRLLHAKFLGLRYVKERYGELASRCSQHDREQGWDYQYFWDHSELERRWDGYRRKAKRLFDDAGEAPRISENLDHTRLPAAFGTETTLKDLAVFVVSWGRPDFLRQTLDSLFPACEKLDAEIFAVDNGSDEETRRVILEESRLTDRYFMDRNLGINGALEASVPSDLLQCFRNILISDADMQYQLPLRIGIELLDNDSTVGAVSYQHSPEHREVSRMFNARHEWIFKDSERGCALLMRTADFAAVRPLPTENLKDFDWWVMRDAPHSVASKGRKIAVLPGGARHLGWRQGDSTWQPEEIPEFAEYRS